jgi:PEGA domain
MALPPSAARRYQASRGLERHRFYLVALLGTIILLAVVATLTLARPWSPTSPTPHGSIAVRSEPEGARAELDGRSAGPTPARLDAPSGEHRLTFRLEGYIPTNLSALVVENAVTTVNVELWLATARVQRLRPVFPGSVIRGATFLVFDKRKESHRDTRKQGHLGPMILLQR